MSSFSDLDGFKFLHGEQLDYRRVKEKRRLEKIFLEYWDAFVYELDDKCWFNKFEARIKVTDTEPIYKESSLSWTDSSLLEDEINNLIEIGIIEYANDGVQWSSPAHMKVVNGISQLCVDYSELNYRTLEVDYHVPSIKEVLKEIPCYQNLFTKLVLKDGFSQIVIDKRFRHLTAFQTDYGHYQYTTMNSQLINSREYLQKAVQTALDLDGDLNDDNVVFYLGQILVFSKDYDTHFDVLSRVLNCLNECNLKIGIEESCFFMKSVKYLGVIVGSDGLSITEETKEKIRNFPMPGDISELRSFLGLVGHYKFYCQNVSHYDYYTKQLRRLLSSNHFYFDYDLREAFYGLKNLFVGVSSIYEEDSNEGDHFSSDSYESTSSDENTFDEDVYFADTDSSYY